MQGKEKKYCQDESALCLNTRSSLEPAMEVLLRSLQVQDTLRSSLRAGLIMSAVVLAFFPPAGRFISLAILTENH